jgi:hypothetical protein
VDVVVGLSKMVLRPLGNCEYELTRIMESRIDLALMLPGEVQLITI